MKRMMHWFKTLSMSSLLGLGLSGTVLASEADTSATAGNGRFNRNGTATATAGYQGDIGFARTDSRSGRISTARGVAVGVDEDGLSLSVSHAIAPRFGPALATNFNLSIGTNGEVAHSVGRTVSQGPISREATASGATRTGRNGSVAVSEAAGRSDRFGRVDTETRARNSRGPRLLRPAGRTLRSPRISPGRLVSRRDLDRRSGPRIVRRGFRR